MGYIALLTTKLDESVEVATSMLGLGVISHDASRAYLSASGTHHEMVYTASDIDAVDHFGLVARDADALSELRDRVDAAGYRIVSDEPLVDGASDGFAFVGPENFVFAIYRTMERPTDVQAPAFGPDRYGHINLHPQDATAMKTFLMEVLDFKLSDVIGDDYAYFLRCNPDHHGIALIAGRGTLHHHAWQTESIADLGKLGDRLFNVGRRLIWGPVRHGAGHNMAAYYVEPSGAVVELYTDMEQIYDDLRPPIEWDSDDRTWFNRWGVYRGEDFRTHGLFPAPLDRFNMTNKTRGI
ncbi:VOC family protein [Citricoccus parietis]